MGRERSTMRIGRFVLVGCLIVAIRGSPAEAGEPPPQPAVEANARGIQKATRGSLEEAVSEFTRAIGLAPRYANAYNNRANARAGQGDLAGAIADFTKAIEIDPRLADAYYNRGRIRKQVGQLEAALADYDRAIALAPRRVEAYVARATVRGMRGDSLDAIADCSRAIELDPQYALAYVARGTARCQQEEWEKGIADYSRAIEINPQYALAYVMRGSARLVQGEEALAKRDFDRALELDRELKSYVERAIDEAKERRGQAALPAVPEGYSWERARAARAVFLRPKGWHFKSAEKQDTLAYFITKELIPPDAKLGTVQFETGISINVLRQVPQSTGRRPSEYARSYIEEVRKSPKHETVRTFQPRGGPLAGFGIEIREKAGDRPLRMHHVLFANDSTGTLYLVIFETPAASWDKEWPIAEKVLKQLGFDPKF
jgi:tetratricopeptide (TPR) repeat protein